MSVIEVVICHGCDAPAPPSSTVCGECGERLAPPTPNLPLRHGADCPCTACTIAAYDEGRAL